MEPIFSIYAVIWLHEDRGLSAVGKTKSVENYPSTVEALFFSSEVINSRRVNRLDHPANALINHSSLDGFLGGAFVGISLALAGVLFGENLGDVRRIHPRTPTGAAGPRMVFGQLFAEAFNEKIDLSVN